MKNIAIITGITGGLGKEFLRLLIQEKNIDEIWGIARNLHNLEELKNEFGKKLKTFSCDLSLIDSIKTFEKELKKNTPNIKILINNAGYAKFCSYDEISLGESINMINLNVNGVVGTTLVCLPYMKEGSKIINIASQASFQPLPYMNIYASSKAFVKSYSLALSTELKSKKIAVTCVCPTWIDTGFFNRANTNAKKSPKYYWGIIKPDYVAKKALKASLDGKEIVIIGWFAKLCYLLSKIFSEKTMIKGWLIQQKL